MSFNKQFLNEVRFSSLILFISNLFQSGIVLGRNEQRYTSVRAQGCCSLRGWWALVDDNGNLIGRYWGGIHIKSFIILNNRTNLACFRLSCKEGHFNSCSICEILSGWCLFHGWLRTKRAALCCTISNLCINPDWWGSQIGEQYIVKYWQNQLSVG